MRKAPLRTFLRLVVGTLLCLLLAQQPLMADGMAINVYLDGQQLQFADAQPVIVEGRTLVPFRKLFESLGFAVEWVEDGSLRQAIGVKDGLRIALTIDSTVAQVNGHAVTLDVPAQLINGRTMVPLRFVSENSGYAVSYSSDESGATIGITRDQLEPYVVKGRVTDADGRPLAGVKVYADNQLLYDSNLEAVTDADGRYRIELDPVAVTWNMSAQYATEVEGQPITSRLSPTVDEDFAGNTGAIRDFVWTRETGYIYLYTADWSNPYDDQALPPMESEVELTLTPVSAGGQSFTTRGYNFPGGFGLQGLPLGRYKLNAVWVREGQAPVPMLVRMRNQGEFAPSTEFGFEMLVPGVFQAEIEVKLPVPKP